MPGRSGIEGRAAQRSPCDSPDHGAPEEEEPDTKNLSQLSDIACLMESDPAALLSAMHPGLSQAKLGSQDQPALPCSWPGPSQNYADMLASLPAPAPLTIAPLNADSQSAGSSQMSLGSQLCQLAAAASALPAQPPTSSPPPLREAAAQRQQEPPAAGIKGIDVLHAAAALCAANEVLPAGAGTAAGAAMVPVLGVPPKYTASLLGKGFGATQQPAPSAAGQANLRSPSKQPGPHPSVQKIEHKGSRATRRGPMDEMRQLVRILVKLVPNSIDFLSVPDEGGGGNRVSEEQIKDYLRNALGEAPQPTWGLPDGWGGYLSELFTWAAGREVTREQAMKCARRQPGRSWEAVNDEIMRLGLNTFSWMAPLTRANVRSCCTEPGADAQPISSQLPVAPSKAAMAMVGAVAVASGDSRKRSASSSLALSDDGMNGVDIRTDSGQGPPKRFKFSADPPFVADVAKHSEITCWQIACVAVEQALQKAGTTPSDQLHDLHTLQHKLQAMLSSVSAEGAGGDGSARQGGGGSSAQAQPQQQQQAQQLKLLQTMAMQQVLSDGRLGMLAPALSLAGAGANAFVQGASHPMALQKPTALYALMPLAGSQQALPASTSLQQLPRRPAAAAVAATAAQMDAAAKHEGIVKPSAAKPAREDILSHILRSQESQTADGAGAVSGDAADGPAACDIRLGSNGSNFQPYSSHIHNGPNTATPMSGSGCNGSAATAGSGSALPGAAANQAIPEAAIKEQPDEQRDAIDVQTEHKALAANAGAKAETMRSRLYAVIDGAAMMHGQSGVPHFAGAGTAPMQVDAGYG